MMSPITAAFLLIVGSARVDDPDLDRLASFMTGSFSSRAQSERDDAYFDVRLQMARIWPDRQGEVWLYVEQAMADQPEKPYRQRVYKLEADADGLVSRVFTLPGDPLSFAGAWKDAAELATIGPDDLSERAGCAIHLKPNPDGTFGGSTEGSGCVSDLRGASYATSEVTIGEHLLESWDRGFDADGKQVWGAVRGPYEFAKDESGAAPE